MAGESTEPRRFQGAISSEIKDITDVFDTDPLQIYHDPNGSEDDDAGAPLYVAQCTPMANCTTAGGTAAKVATLDTTRSFRNFTLKNGREVIVFFANANNVNNPTFNLANTGAFPMRLPIQASGVVIGPNCWPANSFLHLKYVETASNQYWLILGHNVASSDSTSTKYGDGTIEYVKSKVDDLVNGVGLSKVGRIEVPGNSIPVEYSVSYGYAYIFIASGLNGGEISGILTMGYNLGQLWHPWTNRNFTVDVSTFGKIKFSHNASSVVYVSVYMLPMSFS